MQEHEHLALAILSRACRDAGCSVHLDSFKTRATIYKDILLIENALDACEWLLSDECELYCDALGYEHDRAVKFADKELKRWTYLWQRAHTWLGNQTLNDGRVNGLRSGISQ